jgi:Protein of unknown function (DUF3828)
MISVTSRRRVLAVSIALPFALTARAEAQSRSDPAATLRALYARPDGTSNTRFLSMRLRRLFTAQERRSRESSEMLPGLDFDFPCDCQDADRAKLMATLVITPRSQSGRRASLDVSVDNGAGPFALTYTMIFENDRWLIYDVEKTSGETYLLSEMLQRPE